MKKKLVEVIEYTYPQDYKKYCNFFLTVDFKEKKSKAKYDFYKKFIIINSLSRPSSDIFISMLEKAAEHIDIIERKETHFDRTYLKILFSLLRTSLIRNIISITDLVRMQDETLKKALQENFGTFTKWEFEKMSTVDINSKIYVHVFEAYLIKNILKANRFIYDPEQNCWSIQVDASDSAEIEALVHEYKHMAEFVIVSDNSFFIRPVYLLRLFTYSYEYNDLLKSLYYTFNKQRRCWQKIIYASDLELEYEQIKDIPKQRIQIQKYEQAKENNPFAAKN